MPEKIFGLQIVVASEIPKYQLPMDVPVTEEFRADFNKWAREFFGVSCLVPPGTFYKLSTPYEALLVHPSDYQKLKDAYYEREFERTK